MQAKIGYKIQPLESTVSSSITTYEKEFAEDDSPSTKWRSTGIVSETFLMDLGSALLPAVFAWFGSNVESGDTLFTISAGTTSFATNKIVNLTKNSKGSYEILGSDGWLAYRYWKITVTKASGDYVEFGKIALYDNFYEFDRNYNWNYVSGTEDHNNIEHGKYGQISKDQLFERQIYSLSFASLSDTQVVLFNKTIRSYKFIIFYDPLIDEVFFGIIEFSQPSHRYDNSWSMSASFTEAL